MVEQQQVMGLMGWMVGRGGCRRAMTVVCGGCARHGCARRMCLGLIFSSWREQAVPSGNVWMAGRSRTTASACGCLGWDWDGWCVGR